MKKASKKRNIVIAQSGGPTMVINESLAGAAHAARKSGRFGKILGAKHGILGILSGDYVDLGKVSEKKLMQIAATRSRSPSSSTTKAASPTSNSRPSAARAPSPPPRP